MRASGARVLLLGLRIPPNYGPDYTEQFEAMYPEIAEDLDVPLVPLPFRRGRRRGRSEPGDGIHPTTKGQEMVATTVEPYLAEILEAPVVLSARRAIPSRQLPSLGAVLPASNPSSIRSALTIGKAVSRA